jgi:hypothetical protein
MVSRFVVSFKQKSPPPAGGVKKVEVQPIIITSNLLEWMGYKDKVNFVKPIFGYFNRDR